jgi:hypothetical protein
MEQQLYPRPRFRPRISLLTSLLLMTIVGLTIVVAQLWREVVPLREENRGLRDEVGRLSIDDPTKTSVIEVRTTDDFTWKWRVWIPEGRAYQLQMATEDIPKTGYPESRGTISLDEPGETWIEYRIAPSPNSELWMDKLSTPTASVGSSSQPWVKWKRHTSTGEGVGHSTDVFEPGSNVLIARHRVSQTATSSDKIEDPSAGFMIWLEPVK